MAPPTTPQSNPIPTFCPLRECLQDPELPVGAYLMAAILSVTLLFIFSIFWAKQFLWSMG